MVDASAPLPVHINDDPIVLDKFSLQVVWSRCADPHSGVGKKRAAYFCSIQIVLNVLFYHV